MEKRCDSVDALMYAYYELMRKKEENKMLEKNKICIEFSMRSMMITHKPYQEDTEIDITGMIPGREILANNSFDIPCEVVMVPKKEFERLQAAVDINAEIAKEWEKNYDLLLKKTGFDTVESLVFYLTNVGQSNTLLEALASLRDRAKYTCDEWKDLNRKLQECEKDYISERDKAEALEKENEELKKKLQVPDPFAEYKEMLKKLNSAEDAENLEWVLNHTCEGQASVNGWMVTAKLWRQNYETLSKLVGFVTVEELQDYLTNEAECDTLQEAILKFIKENKYACEKWCNANSSNNSWKAAAECNSPKELIEKIKGFRDEIGIYSRALKDWKEETGCPSPSAAKTMIESQASWCHAYNEVKEKNEKLGESIKQWQEATGCDTPDKARNSIANMVDSKETTIYLGDVHNVIAKWQKATGFDRPEVFLKWKTDIEGIMKAWKSGTGCKYPAEARILLEKWKVLTKCETPEAAATWITSYESACERGNRLAESVKNLKEEVVSWKSVTGYSTPEDFLSAKINKVVKEVSSWEEITGFSTPEKCSSYIDTLEKKLEDIKDLIEED